MLAQANSAGSASKQPVDAYFYQKNFLMKFSIPASIPRFLLLAGLTAAGLLTSACKKDELSDEEQLKKYIADNKITNAERKASGLYYVPVLANSGQPQPRTGDSVFVLYTGTLMNGSVFDATSRRGNKPFGFVLGRKQVIAGWDEGIALMRKGEKAKLLIPSSLAYGSRGAGSSIPPNAAISFDVELVNIK